MINHSKAFNQFSLSLCTTAILALTLPTKADTVILSTGEKVDCTVIEETTDFVRIEFQVTDTITDERKIPRAEIAKIIKLRPDEQAFASLKELVPTPDRMEVEDYDKIINSQIRPFLTSHPSSPLLSNVKEIHATLVDERVAAEGGARKIKGEWMSAQQYAQESYNLNAEELVKEIDIAFEKNRYIDGLRTFEQLEKNFGASAQYPLTVGKILGIAPRFYKKLDFMEEQHPLLAERRSSGLANLPAYEKQRSQTAVDNEIAKYAKQREDEKLEGTKWRTIWEYDLSTIEEARKTLDAETVRLQSLDLTSITSGNALAAKANHAILAGNFETATKLIEQSREMGGNETYLTELEGSIVSQEALVEANEAAAAAASAAERDSQKAMEAAVQAPTAEGVAAESSSETTEAAETASTEPDAAAIAAKKKAAREAATAEATANQAGSSTGGISFFNKLLMGLALILVVVTAAAIIKKKSSGDDEEDDAEAANA